MLSSKKRKLAPEDPEELTASSPAGTPADDAAAAAPVATGKAKTKGGLKADKIAGMLISLVEPVVGKKKGSSAAADDAAADDSTASVLTVATAWRLDARLVTAVQNSGLKRFFPIQMDVIPAVLAAERGESPVYGDICVSAPTGSGKTIAYSLPIVQVRAIVGPQPLA